MSLLTKKTGHTVTYLTPSTCRVIEKDIFPSQRQINYKSKAILSYYPGRTLKAHLIVTKVSGHGKLFMDGQQILSKLLQDFPIKEKEKFLIEIS